MPRANALYASNPTLTLQELEKTLSVSSPSEVHPLELNWHNPKHCQLFVKRDDMLHPVISGNKWRKLKYTLLHAIQAGSKQLLSFGGGYSNHLHALGYACYTLNLPFTAIVRGDYTANPSPMLQDLQSWGTNILYVNKQLYLRRNQADYLAELKKQFPACMLIPEGGSSQHALQGVGEILSELQEQYDYLLMPVGSGGTLAGLIAANSSSPTHLTGIAVLKGQGYLEELVTNLLPDAARNSLGWKIEHDYHCGGYAKKSALLLNCIDDVSRQTGLTLEPVYSGKLFLAVKTLLSEGHFATNSRVLLLHTGGLQGAR